VNNDDRAATALTALQEFADRMYGSPEDRDLNNIASFEQCVSDFLANLGHACDRATPEEKGEVWHRVLHRAGSHYFEEVREEDGGIGVLANRPSLTVINGGDDETVYEEPVHFLHGPEPEAPEWTT